MGRSGESFARRKAKYKPQARTLIICEDKKSCLQYLRDAARALRSYADVEIVHTGYTDPKGIVEAAISRSRNYDNVYCAIDRDRHENFTEALRIANDNKVDVVVSYPCYEFWLLLHFNSNRKPYVETGNLSPCDALIKDLAQEPGMSEYAKRKSEGLFENLSDRLSIARKNAKNVLQQALADNNMNPSTRMHVLIDLLEALGKPQLA